MATIRARIASTVGLARPAPLVPVGAVDLDHGHTSASQVTGETGAVAAGSLDPYHGDGPEAAQPGQQIGVAGRGGR
ncbi:MAG: hypothetical protein M3137_13650, partial [Actinomycetota bacterium]|nr:hypothetical protein [Actinomycetota bacterium]